MGRAFSLAAALSLSAEAVAAPATQYVRRAHISDFRLGQSAVRFLFEDSRVYVPVRIRGSDPRWFILDTGATPTVIDKSFAEELGLNGGGDTVVKGAGSGSMHQSQAGVVTLLVGNTPLQINKTVIADLATRLGPTTGRKPSGIIGSQFFREHFVQVDFSNKLITLSPPSSGQPAGFKDSVPLTFDDGTPLTKATLTLPSGRRLTANVLVDLGAKATLLISEPFVHKQRLQPELPKSVITGLGAGVGGNTYYAFARVPSLRVGNGPDLALANAIIGLSVRGTLKADTPDALLGADFLSHFKVGFDYRTSRMLLTRLDHSRPEFDMSGLFLIATGNDLHRIVIRDVVKGSAGDLAGFAPGDEIESLDNRVANTVGLAGIRALLKSDPGASIHIKYVRGSRHMDATIRLSRLL